MVFAFCCSVSGAIVGELSVVASLGLSLLNLRWGACRDALWYLRLGAYVISGMSYCTL